MKMEKVISEYLRSPEQRQALTREEILSRPEEAFLALINFRGPYPESIHPVDIFPDYLSPLLGQLINHHPRLLIDQDISQRTSGQRWLLIDAVIRSENPRFSEIILRALSDRSTEVRSLAVNAIAQCKSFRVAAAKPQLQKLLTMKSMDYYKDEIQKALAALEPDGPSINH